MKIMPCSLFGFALVLILMIALTGCANQPVSASKDAGGESRAWAKGQIQISGYLADLFYVIDNDLFLCSPVEEARTPGTVLTAIGSADQTWSTTSKQLSNGTRTLQYPIFADVRTPTGERRLLIPATLKAKIDMEPGAVLRSADGPVFDVSATRSIKAGDSFPVLFINGRNNTPAILSVEAANGVPFLAAFLRDENPNGRRAAIEAWQIENNRVQ